MSNSILRKIFNDSQNSFDETTAFMSKTEDSSAPFELKNMPRRKSSIQDNLIENSTRAEKHEESDSKTIVSKEILKKSTDAYFERESKFLGTIIQVDCNAKTFTALVKSPLDEINRKMEFSFDEIQEKQIDNIKEGKNIIFIYGQENRNGTQYNVSKIYFRKEMIWTKKEIERKNQEADEMFKFFSVDGENDGGYN